jgi:hypothetical protein
MSFTYKTEDDEEFEPRCPKCENAAIEWIRIISKPTGSSIGKLITEPVETYFGPHFGSKK